MKFLETKLKDLFVIEPEQYQDHRGKFLRIFCENEFSEINFQKKIVQINQSSTKLKGLIRGMHFQYPPKAEIKIVRCIKGSIFDVALDLRKNSYTFLKWRGETLSEENAKSYYIPEGFAHGFQTLEEDTVLLYLHTEFYNPKYEGGIRYNDPIVKIEWPLEIEEVSERDKNFKLLDKDFKGLEV